MAANEITKHEDHDAFPARPSGIAVIVDGAVQNPGLPPERPRVTDLDPKADRAQELRIVWLLVVSVVATVAAVVFYIVFPIVPGDMESVRLNNMLVGTAIGVALLCIGIAAVHWAKALMHGHDLVEERHETRGKPETREGAAEVFSQANAESGFTRRRLLRNSLITAAAVSPLPAIVLLRDLAPMQDPVPLLKHTMWEEGMRLVRDPVGTPIRADHVTLGSVFHVIPEGLLDLEHGQLEEKAKAAVLVMRLRPEDLHGIDGGPITPGREDWSYDGIVAYSKICTHVGCPVALYEQVTHHLLCPCHQSQFDITREARVIFGPAKRPLPQLPIYVDDEGYLAARSDFTEPVGPSFWERVL